MGDARRLIASGRDADIFEHGRGLVLRRARGGRSLAGEARVMEYLRGQGYPVPAVEFLSDDGCDLVMERVEGPSMVQALGRAPWSVGRQGAVLGELHRRLHEVPPPDFLPRAPAWAAGASILHLDLHPLNVLLGPRGPVVIDWTNSVVGDPDVDVALAWVLMEAGEIPGGRLAAKVLGLGRSLLVRGFLGGFDRRAVARRLAEVVEWKVGDPHMSPREVASMRRVVAEHGEPLTGN
jgi:aminoglycoside phosphotransferase (APT) family kinase protein